MNARHRRTAALVAAGLAAIAPSAAQAYSVDASYPPQRADAAPFAQDATAAADAGGPARSGGFDWHDAGVGFVTAAGAALLAGGGIAAARRPQRSASRGAASL